MWTATQGWKQASSPFNMRSHQNHVRSMAVFKDAKKVELDGKAYKLPKQVDETLDTSHLLTAARWTSEELDGVEVMHSPPKDWVDKLALYTVRLCRFSFDIFSGYKMRVLTNTMHERDWLRRVIFLETVAGVPGMVAGMVRHLHSLRLMRRDHGWIHSLLAEAENERMHLLIALQLRRPGPVFRFFVITGQAFFLTWYTLAYLVCPRYCHRFVGYLEEEAVYTYSKLVDEIDKGNLPMFANMRAPKFAAAYYNLSKTSMLRDVFMCIRADESAHRDTNHHFSDMKSDEPNTMVEHLRKGHFQHQSAFSGVSNVVNRIKAENLLQEFKSYDIDGSGSISLQEIKDVLASKGSQLDEDEVKDILAKADLDGDGKLNYTEFVTMLNQDNPLSLFIHNKADQK